LNIVIRYRPVQLNLGIFVFWSLIIIFQGVNPLSVIAAEYQQHTDPGSPNSVDITSDGTNSEIVGRDGYYIKYSNGVVKDTRTHLEWVAGPDKSIIWKEAGIWVKRLKIDGGGWRMPTLDELETLYRKGAGTRNMTPLLETTGFWIWACKTKGEWGAWGFAFSYGGRDWLPRHYGTYSRPFAVRSRNER